jgi:hypothetical protein
LFINEGFTMKSWTIWIGSALTATAIVGCQPKEKIIEVETPQKSIEVERDRKTGDVDIETRDKKKLIDVDVPGVDVDVKKDESGKTGVDVDVNR